MSREVKKKIKERRTIEHLSGSSCIGCSTRQGCKLKRHPYKYTQNEYEAVRSESRQGFAISSEKLKRIFTSQFFHSDANPKFEILKLNMRKNLK